MIWEIGVVITIILLIIVVIGVRALVNTEIQYRKQTLQARKATAVYEQKLSAADDSDEYMVNREIAWKLYVERVGTPTKEEFTSPENQNDSWLRDISKQEAVILKTALMKRAINHVPRWRCIFNDFQNQWKLFDKHLVSQQHWEMKVKERDYVAQELEFIENEAECLQHGWKATVIPQCISLYQHYTEKVQQEKREKKLQKSLKKKELNANQQKNR